MKLKLQMMLHRNRGPSRTPNPNPNLNLNLNLNLSCSWGRGRGCIRVADVTQNAATCRTSVSFLWSKLSTPFAPSPLWVPSHALVKRCCPIMAAHSIWSVMETL